MEYNAVAEGMSRIARGGVARVKGRRLAPAPHDGRKSAPLKVLNGFGRLKDMCYVAIENIVQLAGGRNGKVEVVVVTEMADKGGAGLEVDNDAQFRGQLRALMQPVSELFLGVGRVIVDEGRWSQPLIHGAAYLPRRALRLAWMRDK